MVKKLLLLVGVVGVAVVVAQRIKASNDERALWHEATTAAPDLR